MKPSERRALQEAKRARKIAELNEKEPINENEGSVHAPSEQAKPYKRREGFFQSNAKDDYGDGPGEGIHRFKIDF